MNKLIIRLSELVGVVCLIAFIIFVSSEREVSKADPELISQQVYSAVNTEGLTKRNSLFFKNKYKINTDGFEYLLCYSSDSVMDVRELIVIKLGSESYKSTEQAIREVLSQKQKLYDSYAPEQSALLNSAVLVYEKGYLLLAIGEDAQNALTAFRNSL